MGLLDDLLAIPQQALGIGASVDPTGLTGAALSLVGLGTGAAPASPAGILGGLLQAPGDVVQGLTGGLLGGVLGGGPGPVDTTGFAGGNGKTATRTVVETMDLASGTIIRRKIMPGSPFLMNVDVKAAKKVFRQSAALAKRIPRKTVRQSATSQLKEAAIDSAIRNANSPDERAVIVKT